MSQSHFIVANIIKFGLPLGLSLALGRMVYFYFFSPSGIDADVVGSSTIILVLFIAIGAVLGLIRRN